MKPKTSAHPRIHLTAATLKRLRKASEGTHAFYYARLIEAADEFIARGTPRIKAAGDDNRGYGDILPVLALSYLLSEDRRYLDSARAILNRLVSFESWGDNLDLVTGHFLAGASISYDWLYGALSATERKTLARKISRHAEILNRYSREQRIWWHDYFLHNWAHVITGSLAYAAAALYGEDKAAPAWIEHADRFFTDVERALPEDGSYGEGMAYMTYAWECILRYFDLAKTLFGRDHFGTPWMRKAPYNILYFSTPKPRHFDNCMVFGDGPRHFEWHGPVHLLNRCASEYKDATIQGFSRRLVDAGVGITRTGTWLNMLWYNPGIAAADYRKLPTFKFLGNLDTASMRSSWDEDAVMIAFKCTNNAGRKTMAEYPGRDLGSGHAHPDAASFQIYAFGEWLAVDTGYSHYKQSRDHNTLVINDTQQVGGERTWFDMMECYFSSSGPCEINKTESTRAYDYARADASGIYRWQARLKRFIRHVVFIKPADFLIVDELAADGESKFEWRLHADEEIAGRAREFVVRKNAARLRVSLLAPYGIEAAVSREAVPGAGSGGMKEAMVLSAIPESRVSETVFVTFMSAYRVDAPGTKLGTFSLKDGGVTLAFTRDGRTRTLSLDLAKGKVKLK